jgi:hypothetical protein
MKLKVGQKIKFKDFSLVDPFEQPKIIDRMFDYSQKHAIVSEIVHEDREQWFKIEGAQWSWNVKWIETGIKRNLPTWF